MKFWPIAPVKTIAAFVVIISVPQFVPQLYNWRVYEWQTLPSVLDFQPRKRTATAVEDEVERLRPDSVQVKSATSKIYDATGEMDHFYAALLRTERGQAGGITRILHYGDSPTTADLITADARSMLQQRFGDAGHGTYLIAKPWAWYGHRGVDSDANGWKIDPATLHAQKDGRYGLAGVSFIGQAGAWAKFRVKNGGGTHWKISYLGEPGGGDVELTADGVKTGLLETDAPQTIAASEAFRIPREARNFEIHVTRGRVRLFSVDFENDGPGVIYHSLGLNGMWAGALATYVNERHWAEELKEARPDLVIINYGTNESGYTKYIDSSYPKDVGEILRRLHAAVPEASVLVMSPMDRGAREKAGEIGTLASLPRLVSMQGKIAADRGVAFFNTFEAMGGPGTMGRWYMAEPRLVSADFIHPLPAGARIVGTLLYQALIDGYNSYKLKQLRATLAQSAQPAQVKTAR